MKDTLLKLFIIASATSLILGTIVAIVGGVYIKKNFSELPENIPQYIGSKIEALFCSNKPADGGVHGGDLVYYEIDCCIARSTISQTLNESDQGPTQEEMNVFMMHVFAGDPNAGAYCPVKKIASTGDTSTNPSTDPKPPTKPDPEKKPPTNLTAKISPDDGTVKLAWLNNDPDQVSVQIERSIDKELADYKALKSVSGSSNTYTDDLGTTILPGDNEAYRVRAIFNDGTHSAYSNIATVSNCVSISSGRGINNVVFRRADTLKGSTENYVTRINSAVTKDFASVDPFKKYFDSFSFHIDLKHIEQSKIPNKQGIPRIMNDEETNAFISSTSSCGEGDITYVSLLSSPFMFHAWASSADHDYIFMNVNSQYTDLSGNRRANSGKFSRILIHEIAHAIGHLNDEYNKSPSSLVTAFLTKRNCVVNPSFAFKGSDGIMYGDPASPATAGCESAASSSVVSTYRPSPTSIMYDQNNYNKFNVISCGYIIAGIMHEPTEKEYAEKYWPLCMTLDTIKPIKKETR